MSAKADEKSLCWNIVGADGDTNTGLCRLLAGVVLLIIIGGVLAWLFS